jgi:RNA polymerase sigma-70 factor (ECF subfamily)
MAVDGVALMQGPVRSKPTEATPARATAMSTDASLHRAVTQHIDLVWRVLRRCGLAKADAEDATQDVFWILAQRMAKVPEPARRAFLVSTAVRVAADRRRSKWYRAVDTGLELDERPSQHRPLDEELDLQRAAQLLERALATLDATDRAVYMMAELEQLSRTEVAEALMIPKGTVASRLRRAREAFELAVRRLHRGART